MALKATLESLDDVPEQFHALYEESDGKYRLNVEGVEFEDDVAGLKTALQRERDERKKLAKQLGQAPDPDVMEEYKRLKAEAEKRELEKAEEKGQWEKIRAKLQEEHAKALEEREAALQEKDGYIATLVVDNQLTKAIGEAGVKDEYRTAVEAMLKLRGPKVEKDEDGKYVGVFPDDVHGPKPITEFVKEWAKSDEAQAFLAPSGTSGGGAAGRGAGGAGKVRTKADLKSVSEKVAFIKQHGDEAYIALPDAAA